MFDSRENYLNWLTWLLAALLPDKIWETNQFLFKKKKKLKELNYGSLFFFLQHKQSRMKDDKSLQETEQGWLQTFFFLGRPNGDESKNGNPSFISKESTPVFLRNKKQQFSGKPKYTYAFYSLSVQGHIIDIVAFYIVLNKWINQSNL